MCACLGFPNRFAMLTPRTLVEILAGDKTHAILRASAPGVKQVIVRTDRGAPLVNATDPRNTTREPTRTCYSPKYNAGVTWCAVIQFVAWRACRWQRAQTRVEPWVELLWEHRAGHLQSTMPRALGSRNILSGLYGRNSVGCQRRCAHHVRRQYGTSLAMWAPNLTARGEGKPKSLIAGSPGPALLPGGTELGSGTGPKLCNHATC